MSVSFFIGPFDPALWEHGTPEPTPVSSLRIDPEVYSHELLRQWPNAISHAPERWSWSLDEPIGPGVIILLHQDLQYVSFGHGENFLEFILWHRQVVPANYDLYLFNSSSWDSLLLQRDTTRDAIRHFTGARELRNDSPLNGRWEGQLASKTSSLTPADFRCILTLYEYEDEITGEFVVFRSPPSSGLLSSSLVGPPSLSTRRGTTQLRETRVNDFDSQLHRDFLLPKELALTYALGHPPRLEGYFTQLDAPDKARLGHVKVQWKPFTHS
jgi:hypothetical protein